MIQNSHEWANGLPTSILNGLLYVGCKSKEDVLYRALLPKSDNLSLHKIRTFGKVRLAVVYVWLGLKGTELVNKDRADRCTNYLVSFGYKVIPPDGD